ncbi:hypothetical protein V5M84_002285 [Enterobacter hormaechei]
MEKINKKQMVEKLAKFRATADQINEDLNSLSQNVISIYQTLSLKESMTEEEQAVWLQLKGLLEPILQSTLHSHNYNQSMWRDYTQVVKALGASSDVNSNGD